MSKKWTPEELKNAFKEALNEDLAKEGKQVNEEWLKSHFKVIRSSDTTDKSQEENNE